MTRTEGTLAQALADMKSRQGVELKDLRAGEIISLVKACERVAEPYKEVNADAAGFPVRVCDGVYFWRLSIGASIWLDEVEEMLESGIRDDRYRLALVYALMHSRESEAFDGLDTPWTLEKTLKRTFKRLKATPEEINFALDVLFRQRQDDRKREFRPAASDWASLCARLESQSGVPARVWMWEHSSAYSVKCYNDLNEFARAYSPNPGMRERMIDELDEAVNALQMLKLKIMKRVKHGG